MHRLLWLPWRQAQTFWWQAQQSLQPCLLAAAVTKPQSMLPCAPCVRPCTTQRCCDADRKGAVMMSVRATACDPLVILSHHLL